MMILVASKTKKHCLSVYYLTPIELLEDELTVEFSLHHFNISNFPGKCLFSLPLFPALMGDTVQSGDTAFWLVDAWSHICFMQEAWILSFHTPFEGNIGEIWERNKLLQTSGQLREQRCSSNRKKQRGVIQKILKKRQSKKAIWEKNWTISLLVFSPAAPQSLLHCGSTVKAN